MADKLIGSPKAGIRVVAEVHHGPSLADIVKLPSYAKLEEFAAAMKEEEARIISINAEIDAHPLDGAHALFQVMMQTFGWVGTQTVQSFFGNTPPTFLDVPNGPDTTVSIPWGRLSVPHFDGGYLETSISLRQNRLRFVIKGRVRNSFKPLVQGIVDGVRTFLATGGSLYKGKAITVSFPELDASDYSPHDHQPQFIDTSTIDEGDLMFPADVMEQVVDNIFTPIRARDACRADGVPAKTGVLLEGPPGVGKTLTAAVTAKICAEHNRTFCLLKETEQLESAIEFVLLHGGGVVFAEDIDRFTMQDGHVREDLLNRILNVLDGVDTKGVDLGVILTTNHVEVISKTLLRPGRIDSVIPVRPPDGETAERLIRRYARGRIASSTDLTRLRERMAGFIPASIRAIAEGAKRRAISETGKPGSSLTEDQLLASCRVVAAHHALLTPPPVDMRSKREKAAAIIADGLRDAATMPAVDVTIPAGWTSVDTSTS